MYGRFHSMARGLAVVDALLSLAAVARLPGYTRPEICDEPVVRSGRPPHMRRV
jgi:DNA mismatch repair ATPase MutS